MCDGDVTNEKNLTMHAIIRPMECHYEDVLLILAKNKAF